MLIRIHCSYHSQSPESLFCHVPGFKVVVPRSPTQAKGLLLASVASNDPVIFMEPKILYRSAVEQVPDESYILPLSSAEIVKPGNDLTIISYGRPLYTCSAAIEAAEKDFGVNIELVDLRTVYPWDRQTIIDSVKKTRRAIVVHESSKCIISKLYLSPERPGTRVVDGITTRTSLASKSV